MGSLKVYESILLKKEIAFKEGEIQLVPYDAVNRNKVSIRQLPFFIFFSYSLHVSAPTGHPQVRYTIRCFQGLFLLQRIRCTYTT
jgi:hypothetical protein